MSKKLARLIMTLVEEDILPTLSFYESYLETTAGLLAETKGISIEESGRVVRGILEGFVGAAVINGYLIQKVQGLAPISQEVKSNRN